MALLQGNQGSTGKAVGQNLTAGMGEFSDLLITPLMAKYYENAYRGNIFSSSTAGGGVALAATALFSTAIATFTPILAIYNPLTNNKNLSILHAFAGVVGGAATQATTGGLLWVVGSGQSITNAQSATPVSHLTLLVI
jgi:hypothetical protein